MAWTTFLLLFSVLCAAVSTTTTTETEISLPSTGEPPTTDVVEATVESTAPEASDMVETTETTAQEASGTAQTTGLEASDNTETAAEASGTTGTPPETTSAAADDASRKVALYFTNWGIYGANYQPSDLPVDQITHVIYAFADIAPDGEVKSSDPWADIEKRYDRDLWSDSSNAYGYVGQLNLLKRKNRHLKLLLSIGGWTYSQQGKFVGPASTEEGRQRFASSAVKLVADWGFDGLDVDWEYPESTQEAQDFVLLLEACRKALDEYATQNAPGYHFLLTAASPTTVERFDLAGMDPLLDFWNLMAFTYAGPWDSTSGHQAALFASRQNPESTKYNAQEAVNTYINSGVQLSKIVLGIPLFGTLFPDTDGPGKPFNGEAKGLYSDFPRPGASEYFDDTIGAAYSYDPETRELVSYDNRDSVKQKAQWILDTGLGGGFFWEASGDGDASLVGAFNSGIGQTDGSENLISYPASQYGNIRNGTEN